MKELTVDATIENVAAVTAFVDEQLEQLDCPIKTQCQVDVAIDELFGNIANYAYNPGIYMVKKSMDDISYEYKDGKNILKIKKNI